MSELIKQTVNREGQPVGMFYTGTLRTNGRPTYVVARMTKKNQPMRMRTSGRRITFDPYYRMRPHGMTILSRMEAEQVFAAVEQEAQHD